jgi:integrase
MGFMENVILRGTTYYVVLNIPPVARPAFKGKTQVWKSLRTKDKTEARNRAVPILAALEAQIKTALGTGPSAAAPITTPTHVLISREAALSAIERWRKAAVQRAYEEHWNGLATSPPSFSDEAAALSDIRYKLSVYDIGGIPSFYTSFSDALNSQGIGSHPTHPVLPRLAHLFADAWTDVERHIERFRCGDFDRWPEQDDEDVVSSDMANAPIRVVAPMPRVSIMAAFEAWIAVTKPSDAKTIRGYFQHLDDFLDSKPMADVDAPDLDAFFVALRDFPKSKKDVSHLKFREIIARFERDSPGYERLAPITAWGWMRYFKMVWTFAHSRKLIPENPMLIAMPRKPKRITRRKPYDAADIAVIFSAPLFHGASAMLDANGRRWGYASKPGKILIRDAYYWLPLFALWHGVRLEEIGAAKVADLVQHGGRWAFDWRDRSNMKNQTTSPRLLPIHQKLIDLGFVEYVQSQSPMGFVFPELPHDPNDIEHATRQFSKWWGHWCRANAEVRGAGIDEPIVKVFHSFRHSFKRACRGKVDEEIHDLLTGHRGRGGEGRGYGDGAEFDVLVEAIDKIDYPTFPPLPRQTTKPRLRAVLAVT